MVLVCVNTVFHNSLTVCLLADGFFKLNNLKMDNKIIELANKLLALARRGEGGEKQNAQLKLDALMTKHNITLAQLEGEETSKRKFYITSDTESTILVQVVAKVLNIKEIRFFTNRDERTKRFVDFYLTDAQFLDIDAHFTFYWAIFQKEQKVFVQAFVQSQKLFPNYNYEQTPEQTPEQKAKAMQVLQMAGAIPKATFHKQLNAA
jgi:hypothetical protein